MRKRLFLGFEVVAPWPEEFPKGRFLREVDRHLTLVFLKEAVPLELSKMPKLPFSLGLAGRFDRPLFLPERFPRVAAWHVEWFERGLEEYRVQLMQWLKMEEDDFLPHVTLARRPFSLAAWKKAFQPLPLFLGNFHLYESLGHSRYEVRWTQPIAPPFEEREHTADLAFLIRGENPSQIFLHAQLALSFHFPPFLRYVSFEKVRREEEIVPLLNRQIAAIDEKEGSPFKAVSYHGLAKGEWEMIVDV